MPPKLDKWDFPAISFSFGSQNPTFLVKHAMEPYGNLQKKEKEPGTVGEEFPVYHRRKSGDFLANTSSAVPVTGKIKLLGRPK